MHQGRATGSQLLAGGQHEQAGRAGEHLGLGEALIRGSAPLSVPVPTSEGSRTHKAVQSLPLARERHQLKPVYGVKYLQYRMSCSGIELSHATPVTCGRPEPPSREVTSSKNSIQCTKTHWAPQPWLWHTQEPPKAAATQQRGAEWFVLLPSWQSATATWQKCPPWSPGEGEGFFYSHYFM